MTCQQAYDLSLTWYAGRADVDWKPPTAADAEAAFHSVGLTGEFWALT